MAVRGHVAFAAEEEDSRAVDIAGTAAGIGLDRPDLATECLTA